MKTLIFSDTHLAKSFDIQLFDYIAKQAKKADQIIINGDFWDSNLVNFDYFVNSQWSQLFPLLKNKTIYIYGNHDPKDSMDERVKLFSKVQTSSYQLPVGDKTLMIEHGDRIAAEFDRRHARLSWLILTIMPWLYPWLDSLLTKNHRLAKFYQRYTKLDHRQLLKQLRWFALKNRRPKTIWVFGHSHLPDHHSINRGFVCLGVCRFGQFNSLWVDGGRISFYVSC